MKLTDEQEKAVYKYVEAHNLRLKTLSDDIIDHLCCALESEPEDGKCFDQALNDAVTKLAPNGITDLERKTVHLLNPKRTITMRKLTYAIGYTSAMALAGGALFKLLHLPGANQLFIVGYLVGLLVFVPLSCFGWVRVTVTEVLSKKIITALGVVSSVLLGLAGAFKTMQLPEAHFLLMGGILVFAGCFVPFLLFTTRKRSVS